MVVQLRSDLRAGSVGWFGGWFGGQLRGWFMQNRAGLGLRLWLEQQVGAGGLEGEELVHAESHVPGAKWAGWRG